MDKELFFLNVMRKTKILLPPRHTLATFGSTVLNYVLLSALPGTENQCRRREGRVTAQRPRLITPDLWTKRFEGFGDDTEHYKGVMDEMFGDAFRGLEYTFKNELEKTTLQSEPLRDVADRALDVMNRENAPRTALLQGPDATWSLSVMKFIVEMSLRSFPVNLRELNERDLLDPQQRAEKQIRHRIDLLFKQTAADPAAIKRLGETLQETGLFKEYEDRFFALVKPAP